MIVDAAICAALALVTAFAAIAIATLPAVLVTSPVNAGICAVGIVPAIKLLADPDVAIAASPDTSVDAIARSVFTCAAVRSLALAVAPVLLPLIVDAAICANSVFGTPFTAILISISLFAVSSVIVSAADPALMFLNCRSSPL